jgi:DNA-directed RNA polymerase subunit K/omega
MTDHPEAKPVFRSQVTKAMETPRITRPYFTRYEYVVLMASRQQQLAEGAKPLVSL